MMTETTEERAERLDVLLGRARDYFADKRRRAGAGGKLVADLYDALAIEMNRPLTSCGGPRLADERALRFVERHGWPEGRDGSEMLEWLSATAREAGDALNAAALDRDTLNDEVPF